jgi:hypothetical protein
MIICYTGGIGSGKTLSVIKEIVNSNNFPFTNFRLIDVKYHRLKYKDLFNLDNKKREVSVNWRFWEAVRKNKKDYSIFLDEIGNIASARTSMTRRNKLLNQWLSQIRKVLQDSLTNHIYFITQRLRQIDVIYRELAQIIIKCRPVFVNKNMWIYNDYYNGIECYERGIKAKRTRFLANPYFKYYKRDELIRFADLEGDYV